MQGDIFTRCEYNPILTSKQWPYTVNSVFNPGATIFNNKVLLLVRVEDRKGLSHLVPAISKDGITDWEIDKDNLFLPDKKVEENIGIEDPRIVFVPHLGEYVITYTSFTPDGPTVFLAKTKDFKNYVRLGPLVPPEDKDASIFPVLFNEHYVLIHRPIVRGTAHIWISSSPDLKHWGHHHMLLPVRPEMWDCHRVGLGPPPIETEEGWLVIYHGVRNTTAGAIYRVGAVLLDKEKPWRIMYRSKEWLFSPSAEYENLGDVPGVVFPTGVIVDKEKEKIYMYYGAADSTVCMAYAKIKDICEFIKHN